MKISMAEALNIHPSFVLIFGVALVFIGLICIILMCCIMGAVCKKAVKTPAPAAATSGNTPAASTAKNDVIPNKGEFTAAISAAIGEELGEAVGGFRIKSIKRR